MQFPIAIAIAYHMMCRESQVVSHLGALRSSCEDSVNVQLSRVFKRHQNRHRHDIDDTYRRHFKSSTAVLSFWETALWVGYAA